MQHFRRGSILFCIVVVVSSIVRGDNTAPPQESSETVVSMAFGWPFLDPASMETRGGTTQGSKVTLDEAPSEAWQELQQPTLAKRERDRQAILAMAGSYRVSFQFIESMGFAEDYSPSRPYFSWATEHVRVLEETPTFVSLQHTLVMYFADEEMGGPMVTKHWRQDWTYEDRDLHVYRGNSIWERLQLDEEEAAGAWSQAVFQVDDSPRYEAFGRWEHEDGFSRWTSNDAWRPLPRREFSVRNDYNVLGGTHAITITPTGWVHLQENCKLQVGDESEPPRCLACELGINRYERIAEPKVQEPADAYWAKTGDYWKEVRSAWEEVFRKRDRFQLKKAANGKKLYEEHFGYAAEIEESGEYDTQSGQTHAQETIENFLVTP
ncbi:DUF6607 family protein [Bythopirellula polymerisocia]|uniref:Uncharacterized protein n=1 Tax=Bythopirellula polymerisocia TaxID=2528003 RepID=A0A5C6CZ24_9BACT|nr:DUF6607 family protein [Bythopirellula polymerisocia]TWU30183.1 hypothetical protein Pla144_09690 [Bythopirellula polymerisocia]